ncbi:hypothetical protein [Streptomyces sp. PT12]|uniref:hypothetical protein n=1 Tax=Streptomyces sp. PT12 TaxID=1510197 RepID=UPI000DE494CE|nr:hypothetical protein [Streptomyces sp. PT12]RBM09478.1 hypothetical protein DEH69_22975 [Streptomyces sp. PT12]
MSEQLECINDSFECAGPVQYRQALSGTGQSYPRCEKHWQDRLDQEEDYRVKYPEYNPFADAAGVYDDAYDGDY